MNSNQLIRMLTRLVARKGINKGIDHLARKGKDPNEMTPEERAQAKSSRQSMQQGQKGLRTLRRFMRF